MTRFPVAVDQRTGADCAMRFGKWILLMLLLAARAGAVYYGESKAELIAELGRPTSVLMRGDREILIYPGGGRIELVGGKVELVKGIEVREGPLPVMPVPDPAAEAAQKAAEEKAAAEKLAAEKAANPPAPDPEAVFQAQAAAARAQMEKTLEQLDNPPPAPDLLVETAFNLVAFLVGLGVKALMMLAALKLTCKYWDVQVSWPGLLIAALADTGARAVVLLLFEQVLQMPSAFFADEAIGAIVLLLVLKRVSYNQSTQQAVMVTMTSKVFSIVVGSFLSVLILRSIF